MKRLTRKLAIEERSRESDGAGGYSGGWLSLGTLWAAVDPIRGRQERGDGAARSKAAYAITVRAVPPTSVARPRAGQRFREGTRAYEIRAVLQSSDARYLTCIADEEVAP